MERAASSLDLVPGTPSRDKGARERRAGPDDHDGQSQRRWLYALAPIVGAIIAAVVHMGISVLTDERPAEVAAAE